MNEQNDVVFYSITVPKMKGSTIIHFFFLEFIIGTGLYYGFKRYSSSELIGIIGSMAGVTGIKQTLLIMKKHRATSSKKD